MENILLADKRTIAKWARVASLIIVLACFFMPFASGIKMVVESSPDDVITTYGPAFSFIFGGETVSEHATYTITSPNALALTAFIFFIVSFLSVVSAQILPCIMKDKRYKLIGLAGILLGVAGSIMFLCLHRSVATALSTAITGHYSESVADVIYSKTNLEFGFLGIGIFGLLGYALYVASFFIDGSWREFADLLSPLRKGKDER